MPIKILPLQLSVKVPGLHCLYWDDLDGLLFTSLSFQLPFQQAIVKAIGCSPQTDSKGLLLKTTHTYLTEDREAEPRGKPNTLVLLKEHSNKITPNETL